VAEALLAELDGGRVSAVIVAEARRVQADLIVLGTHGRRGFSRALMGSDAEAVVREATVPVLLIRAADART
jgi:nucleotide-binding universal stress UspA family protein